MPDIVLNHGKNIQEMTYQVMEAFNAAGMIPAGMKIGIKPNLVNSTPPSNGATTHPEVVEGIILYLKEHGFDNITIMESAWVGDNTTRAFRVCGYERLVEKYQVPFLDLKQDKMVYKSFQGTKVEVCQTACDHIFLINVPVLKAHCQTKMTCCIKNLKGCISDREKRNFHATGLHQPIAVLGGIVQTGLNIVDAICGDLTFEEGGTPVQTDMVFGGVNPVLVDSYAAGLLGYRPEEIKHLALCRDYGIGVFAGPDTAIQVLNKDKAPGVGMKASRSAHRLAKQVDERQACSACYSALIRALHRQGFKGGYRKKIHIGQGFKGRALEGIGIGNCADGCSKHVKGCPPKAADIVAFLQSLSLNG